MLKRALGGWSEKSQIHEWILDDLCGVLEINTLSIYLEDAQGKRFEHFHIFPVETDLLILL